MKIKVCGMRDEENIREIAALHPAMMGFIFYRGSKRFVGEGFRPEALTPLGTSIEPVGVFVNEPPESLLAQARRFGLAAVQLHGDESPEYCAAVKNSAPELKIIKAAGVGPGFDPRTVERFEAVVDYMLFDTADEQRGGTGRIFDWSAVSTISHRRPFLVSGGIGPANAEAARAAFGAVQFAAALDINSAVETAPGIKSSRLVREVMERMQS